MTEDPQHRQHNPSSHLGHGPYGCSELQRAPARWFVRFVRSALPTKGVGEGQAAKLKGGRWRRASGSS